MTKKDKISAADVKKLREKTGGSVIECRNALAQSFGDFEKAIEYLRKKVGEKALKKAERATSEGVVSCYIHTNKKVGAMVELLCETDFVARNSEFQELAYHLAMHVAAMDPKYVSADEVPEKDRREYEKIVRDEMAGELASPAGGKKPAEIVEKIIEGKVKKHFSDISLLSQVYVKNPDLTVENLVKEKISKIGENIQVGSFSRISI